MEACGSSHYWARVLSGFGHEVRLIAPRYVRPFVKRQKNYAADAEAIVVAAQRPEMRFVEPKSEAQQSAAILYRSRQRLRSEERRVGKSVSVRVDLGGRRIIKKKKKNTQIGTKSITSH